MSILVFLFIFPFSIVSCISSKQNLSEKTLNQSIDSQIKDMSLRELVGQMFVIRLESIDRKYTPKQIQELYKNGVVSITEEIIEEYEKYPAGGFAIFDRNIKNPEQLLSLNHSIHQLGKIRPAIYIDEEGGIVSRLANNPVFKLPAVGNMEDIAKTNNSEKAYEAGFTIGEYLKSFDIDVNFAPIADVNTNPNNPIIGKRAFGSNPEIAAEMVTAYLKGLQDNNIEGCLKHFPGHGDTKTDTHKGYTETLKNWQELEATEMFTFKKGIASGAKMIMTAHISAPNVTGNNEPATLSHLLLTEKLRNELGFKGIIITDAMEMGAIHKEYSTEESIIKTVEAGVDIILMPYNYELAFDTLVQAVEEGHISRKRIEESVRRILTFKASLNS